MSAVVASLSPQAPPASLLPHVVRICEAAATPLMGSVRVSRSLQENGAITLGRTAMVCPDQVNERGETGHANSHEKSSSCAWCGGARGVGWRDGRGQHGWLESWGREVNEAIALGRTAMVCPDQVRVGSEWVIWG